LSFKLLLQSLLTRTFIFQTQESVFHYCASEGNVAVLKEILANLHSGQIQLAVNKQASNGWSPLIVAASKGHTEAALVSDSLSDDCGTSV
jgi:ankyrin repeat protein